MIDIFTSDLGVYIKITVETNSVIYSEPFKVAGNFRGSIFCFIAHSIAFPVLVSELGKISDMPDILLYFEIKAGHASWA